MKGENQKCTDCHTKTAAAPMKTKLQAAFHDPMAKKGTCVDCHQKAIAAGKKAPAKCADCTRRRTSRTVQLEGGRRAGRGGRAPRP